MAMNPIDHHSMLVRPSKKCSVPSCWVAHLVRCGGHDYSLEGRAKIIVSPTAESMGHPIERRRLSSACGALCPTDTTSRYILIVALSAAALFLNVASSDCVGSSGGADNGNINSNGAVDTGPCETDVDCDDGAFCNGVELCSNGICTTGLAPCTTEQVCDDATDQCLARCADDVECSEGACINGACQPAPAPANDLVGFVTDSEGMAIDLTTPMFVGDRILIESPELVTPAADGLPLECGCAWSVTPTSAGTFDMPDACSTAFVAVAAGGAMMQVDVSCNDALASFAQSVVIIDVPPCESDDDCDAGDICSDGTCITPPPVPSITILTDRSRPPFVVRLDLRLKDETGNVIVEGVTADDFRIYEDGALLDLLETELTVTPLPNLPMRAMLVLDYSLSMKSAGAINTMITAASEFIAADHITATHQIGLIEFHDRSPEGVGYGIVAAPTRADGVGKGALITAIPKANDRESGLSRVWDAVQLAIDTLAAAEPEVGEKRAIVFLTDGVDTSSEATSESVQAAAVAADIALYPIGFGQTGVVDALLKMMAEQSGGSYFPADGTEGLLDAFEAVALDLRGQWNVNYVTPRNTGAAIVRVELDWNGLTGSAETSIDVNQIVFEAERSDFSVASNRTSFVLKLLYAPRNIDRLRFTFPHDVVTFQLQSAGGVLSPVAGWSLSLSSAGDYELIGASPVPFGAFGNIGVVTFPGDVPLLQMAHDDSVFAGAAQPKTSLIEGDWGLPYQLEISISPEDGGNVTVNPDKSEYGHGDLVVLVANPGAGQVFDRWLGDAAGEDSSVVMSMDSDKSVTAVFTAAPTP